MTAFATKTRAEQRLEQFEQFKRPLTDDESTELHRSLHAVYVRNWRQARELKELAAARREEVELLKRLEAEAVLADFGDQAR